MNIKGTYEFFRPTPGIGFFPIPLLSLDSVSSASGGTMNVYTDIDGFRIDNINTKNNPTKHHILFLGASWTWGSWVEYNQRFSSLVQESIDAQVLNGSCPSHSIYQSLLVAKQIQLITYSDIILIDINMDYASRIFSFEIPGKLYRPLLCWDKLGTPLHIAPHVKKRNIQSVIATSYLRWLVKSSRLASNYNDYDDRDKLYLHAHYQRYLAMFANLTSRLLILDTSGISSRFLRETCNYHGYVYLKAPDIGLFDDTINCHPGPKWHKQVSTQIISSL
jgi:hypothetical protein